MRYLAALLASIVAFSAFAAPPYDVTVTLTAPSSGGPVDGYELRVNGVSKGPLAVGVNSFPALIIADGTYTFEAAATNAAGTTLSDPVTYTITALAAPGKPIIQIQIDCAPCVIT